MQSENFPQDKNSLTMIMITDDWAHVAKAGLMIFEPQKETK